MLKFSMGIRALASRISSGRLSPAGSWSDETERLQVRFCDRMHSNAGNKRRTHVDDTTSVDDSDRLVVREQDFVRSEISIGSSSLELKTEGGSQHKSIFICGRTRERRTLVTSFSFQLSES
jgi:hypothetical protein